jgi:hypothetical protein
MKHLDQCKVGKINETQTQSFIGFLLNNSTGEVMIKPTNQLLHFNNDFPHVKLKLIKIFIFLICLLANFFQIKRCWLKKLILEAYRSRNTEAVNIGPSLISTF